MSSNETKNREFQAVIEESHSLKAEKTLWKVIEYETEAI
jgi:hypothetical protein